MTQRDKVVLRKFLSEIKILEDETSNISYEVFLATETIKRTAAMTLINIGELARCLSDEFRKNVTGIPVKQIIGLRDRIVHGYATIDFEIVWSTIKEDIPVFKANIENLLELT